MIIRYKKLHEDAIEPTRGSEWAAGYDLYAAEDKYIDKNQTVKVGTGIAVEIPHGYFGGIYARSGLATKEGIRPANCVGIVDADYRGEIIVALHNEGVLLKEIHKGDRIAQLVIQPCISPVFKEVDDLTDTNRGEGGFGSTGVNAIDAFNEIAINPNTWAPLFKQQSSQQSEYFDKLLNKSDVEVKGVDLAR